MVHDGAAGLAKLEDFRADIVLLDIGLPRMDGYMVAHAIRERFALAGRRPKLLALTGYGRDDDRNAALKAGFRRTPGKAGGSAPPAADRGRRTAGAEYQPFEPISALGLPRRVGPWSNWAGREFP